MDIDCYVLFVLFVHDTENLATQISLSLYVVLHNETVNVESKKMISTPIDGNRKMLHPTGLAKAHKYRLVQP